MLMYVLCECERGAGMQGFMHMAYEYKGIRGYDILYM
jgi:hypothetical protein